ncbi:MAG: undecaprenyl-diphosphatase UppP [Thermomicrobiales bacterium]
MSILEAIVLGLVQGLTEFLPISSSAHLIIVPWLFGWERPGLAFDASLHLGTLVAVIVYFWRELVAMVFALPRALRHPLTVIRGDADDDGDARLSLLIALGTVPGAVIGLLGEGTIADLFHGDDRGTFAMALIAVLLMALGLALALAERVAEHTRPLAQLTIRDVAIIGLAQAVALLPGVSRSGATITAGLFRGLRRADAARFSFLLGIPLVAGAGAKGFIDVIQSGLDGADGVAFVAGMLASALSGFVAISFLLRYLQRSNTLVFVVYRLGLGIVILGLLATGLK